MAPPLKADRPRVLWVADEDISAAARLLSLLRDQSDGLDASSANNKAEKMSRRRRALERARLAHYARQRRIELFGQMFTNEPPFQMLLSLYVSEDRESPLTMTKLTELSSLAPSTALRWLEPLSVAGWITRTGHPQNRRKAQIHLTDQARNTLEVLFGWVD
jgi:DNA-binding MarR family transcriptional regulator